MILPGSSVMVSAGAVVFDTVGRVLTLVDKRSNADTVYFPKGRVEPGESLEDAAAREVEQETGVKCDIHGEVAAMQSRYSVAIGKTKVIFWFKADFVEDREQQLEGHESFKPWWVDASIARSVLSFDDDRELLDICLSKQWGLPPISKVD